MLAMLTYDQTKAMEAALGPEKAAPFIEAFQASDARVMTALLAEVATKQDIAALRGELRGEMAAQELRLTERLTRLEGRFDRLETLLKLLIALAAMAVAFFSPVAAKLLSLL